MFSLFRAERIAAILCAFFLLVCCEVKAQNAKPKFKVIAFYTAQEDKAHISFVHEANPRFAKMAAKNKFMYDSTKNWNNLNPDKQKIFRGGRGGGARRGAPARRGAGGGGRGRGGA